MNKKLSIMLRISFSFILILILIQKVGIEDILNTIKKVPLFILLAVIIISILSLLMGGINIALLLSPLAFKIPLIRLLRYYMISWSIGLIIPGKLGEFSLIYFLKKEKLTLGQGLVIAFLDKLITIILYIFIAFMGFWLIFPSKIGIKVILIFLILVYAGFFILISSKFRKFVREKILRKYSIEFRGFSTLLFSYFKERKMIIAANLLITFLKLVVQSLAFLLLFVALGYKTNILYIATIFSIITIISLIPITISGIGLREPTFVLFFYSLGIPTDISTSVIIIASVLQYVIGAMFYIIGSSKNIKTEASVL